MPILERTPPPKKAAGISPSPAPPALPVPAAEQPPPVASTSSLATPSQRGAAAAMSEFPSLEDMARPHLLNRAVQEAEAAARPTPVRSASVRPLPASASRSNLSRIAGPTSGLPQLTGAAAVSASLPRPSPGRAGALYPAVGAAAKRAGDLTSRSSRTSLTGLEAARARTEGTPAAVAAALAQRDSAGAKTSEEEEAAAMSAVATADIDVEARSGEPTARLCSPVVEALAAQGTPKGAASPRRTPLRAARLSGAGGSVARQAKASPRSTPRRTARRSSQLASAAKPASSSGADEEFVRRLEAAMQAGDNPFADKRKADMRKSVGHPSAAQTDASGFGAASSSAQPPSEWESRLDAALQAGDDPFQRRSNLRDDEQAAGAMSAVSTPRANKAELDLPAAAAQASGRGETQAEEQGDKTGPIWPSANPVIAALAASRDGGRSSPISYSQQRPVPSSPIKASQTSFVSSPHRLDPSARAERVVNMELAELKKAHAALTSELQHMQREADAAREDADGWKAECEGEAAARAELASELDVLKAAHAKERRKREAAELQVLEARCEADEREWARLTGADAAHGGKEALRDANIELVVCRNEATYQTYRGHELTRALDQANAELKAHAQQARVAAQEGSKAKDAELEELRQKLQDEKERRKNVAREGMRVEEERDAAREELETLKKRQDKAASSASSEALKRAEARAEREEEKRKQLEKEVRELRRIAGRSVPSPAPVRRAAPVVPAPAPRKRKETTPAPDSDVEPAFSVAGARAKPLLPKARSALTRAPMQGASDAAPPPSDADLEVQDDEAGTPSPPKRPVALKSLAVKKTTKAPTVAAPRYAPAYRDVGSDSEDNASDYDVGKTKTRTVGGGAATKARSTVKPLSGATVARKRKSVEADEARRKALEADIMATPMVKAPVRTLKVAPHNVVAAAAAAKPAAAKAAAAEPVDLKKKKRKLLGAAGAQGPGFFKWPSSDGDAISSGLDLPMDLSPIKAANPHAMRPAAPKSGAPFAR